MRGPPRGADPVTVEIAARWLRLFAAAVHERRQWLTELDAAIGDGDHGINLDRGLAHVIGAMDSGALPLDDGGRLVTAAGRLILGTVGGASGALYGRGFIRAGERLTSIAAGRSPTEPLGVQRATALTDALAIALADGTDSIASLGRSRPGEKTMLDALVPAAEALRTASHSGVPLAEALRIAADDASAGAAETVPMRAMKGRASYLGARSIGHLDPGAASSALLLGALADAAKADGDASRPSHDSSV